MATRQLAREIAALRDRLLDMATLVGAQFTDAVDALLTGNIELADAVIERDADVDALELEIDRQCERILALHQPVASDLRALFTVEKLNTDLERMGDHCVNLAQGTPHVAQALDVVACTRLREMAEAARRMVDESKRAFLERDEALARRIPALDDTVDALHRNNFHALVDHIQEHPEHAEVAAHLLTASKALERISDHATNIAKGVVFLIEGVDIRHT